MPPGTIDVAMPVSDDADPAAGFGYLDYDALSQMIPTRVSNPAGCCRNAASCMSPRHGPVPGSAAVLCPLRPGPSGDGRMIDRTTT